MATIDKVDMSLDDIIKMNRKKTGQKKKVTGNKQVSHVGRTPAHISGVSPLNRIKRQGNQQNQFKGKQQNYNNVQPQQGNQQYRIGLQTQARKYIKKSISLQQRKQQQNLARANAINQQRGIQRVGIAQRVGLPGRGRGRGRGIVRGYMHSDFEQSQLAPAQRTQKWQQPNAPIPNSMVISVNTMTQNPDVEVQLKRAPVKRQQQLPHQVAPPIYQYKVYLEAKKQRESQEQEQQQYRQQQRQQQRQKRRQTQQVQQLQQQKLFQQKQQQKLRQQQLRQQTQQRLQQQQQQQQQQQRLQQQSKKQGKQNIVRQRYQFNPIDFSKATTKLNLSERFSYVQKVRGRGGRFSSTVGRQVYM